MHLDSVTLFDREISWPVPDDFVWPYFERFAFYEHRGSFRDSWPGPACSVADRPTDAPPLEGDFHFVMSVHAFLAVYPYPIGIQTHSVTCYFTTYAQNQRWPEFIKSGQMFEKVEENLLMLYIGDRAMGEHPPSALDYAIGPPTVTTTTWEHGPPADDVPTKFKTICMRLRNLPVVPPSHLVPVSLQRPRASHPDPEVQMLLRSSFTKAFAQAHVAVWDTDSTPVTDGNRPAPVVAPGYTAHRQQMLCNFSAFVARYAPTVSRQELATADRSRLLIAVPVGMGKANERLPRFSAMP